ncbi:type II secretion system protein GspG [Alteromonas confluentis]|uniref:Type II secretion system core protein G n=2 Tax=Alteromonas confluentis TaxID=1656094 RepID=A0A1E7ZDR0_9ALTE|nr:type II secretion system major pseudopilin GspG [Alteromonas confluentis]OFC71646.1 type II secretion system protein GspG [Alteromonas confluentis]
MRKMRRHAGFTLIEVMIVLVIIGIIASMVLPNVIGNQEIAQKKKAAVDIQQLEGAIAMYKMQANRYPSTEQGLEALVEAPTIEPIPKNYPKGGIIQRLPEDPWGNPYQFMSPGEMGEYDIYSNGPDGEPGTDDDIGTWNVNEYL